jgi:hypothetical protein
MPASFTSSSLFAYRPIPNQIEARYCALRA